MSTPLTACLVVLGKYVPFLKVFDTLLGDQPALEPHIGFYQRLLARDQDEANDIAEEHFRENSLEQTYDGLLIPALNFAKRDLGSENLGEEEQRNLLATVREIVESLSTLHEKGEAAAIPEGETVAEVLPPHKVAILGCPARDEADEVALIMLKELLALGRCQVSLSTAALMVSQVVSLVEEEKPSMLCIAALPPGGSAHTRLLCLRLRSRFPDLKIFVGRWGYQGEVEKAREQLIAAGADYFGITLAETSHQMSTEVSLLPNSQPEVLAASPGSPQASSSQRGSNTAIDLTGPTAAKPA